MAASNTFDTTNLGSAVSNTEELTRGAYLISPANSPFYSNTNKSKASSIMPEWTLDDLDDPDNTPIPEGADASAFADEFKEQARVFNYIQTLQRNPMVTDDQELVDNAAGVNYAGAVMKALKELNRDTEKALLSANARSISGSTRTTAGLADQLSGASAIFPAEYETPTAQVVTGGSAPTEANVDTVLQSIFDESGEDSSVRIYGGSAWIQAFANNTMRLTSSSNNFRTQVNLNGEKGTIKNKIRVYEGQFGTAEVVNLNSKTLTDTTNKDMAYFINPNYVEIKELGGLIQKELPDLGGGRRSTIRRKFALCVKNPRAHAYWDTITA
jgi:hypothetical protein